jgi:Hint domain
VVPNDASKPIRLSRRHFFKAVAVVVGAVAAPGSANAQWDRGGGGGGGWGDGGHPWGNGGPFGGGGSGGGGFGGGGGYHCFLRGTLIRTGDESYRAIETLKAGESLPARFSGTSTIRKMISYTVRRDAAGRWPEDGRLVRIGAGALGEAMPARDLFVTEAHAVLLNDVLIPIGSLVNGKTISFEDRAGPLDFFHVELDSHDVIDAEGAFCESRRDLTMEPCAPVLNFNGRRSEILSHLRSAIAPIIDRRRPLDRIRDGLEIRAGL